VLENFCSAGTELTETEVTIAQTIRGEEGEAEEQISLVIYHRSGAQIAQLLPGETLVLGRARPADVAIKDPSLSRQHASFSWHSDGVWVEDLHSTNGTKVNGKKITRVLVGPGDEIGLGAVTVSINCFAPRDPALQGLDGHDLFRIKLEEEVTRAKTFHRKLALVMAQATGRNNVHLSHWFARVRGLLRAVDRVALYGPSALLMALPEMEEQAVRTLLETMVQGRTKEEPPLVCGAAIYPDDARSPEELIEVARLAAQQARRDAPVQMARKEHASGKVPLVLSNPRMKEIFATLKRVSDSMIPILIQGETGTGKEVVARAIHQESKRRRRSLHCVNCGAIPAQLIESVLFGHERGAFTGADQQRKGLFEEGQGGTILLDEVGELSAAVQAALLRVLENKYINRVGSIKEIEVDVRILAATHRDLEEMCQSGAFRWDLFYRLNAMIIKIPPLRERTDELLPLVEFFLDQSNRANHTHIKRVDPAAQQLLLRYAWPGNVRELRNVIERAVLIAQDEVITVDDLSERLRPPKPVDPIASLPAETGEADLKLKLRQYEAQLIIDALSAHDWNQTEAAKALGMPLRTLVHKIKLHGIKKSYQV
jgi:two-component system, NtrC family, response regulator AtoC